MRQLSVPPALRNLKKNQVYVVFIVVFGAVGTLLIITSHAATSTPNIEAENGTLSSCASSVTDTTASNSGAVKFSTCATGSPPLSLDASGATIPDTDYAIPAGAIFMATTGSDSNAGTQSAPVLTLNKAVSLVPAGGTIVVRAGDYRDWYNNGSGNFKINTKPMTIQAYPHEQVWFDGADTEPTSNWTSDGAGHWYMDWSTPSFCSGNYYEYAPNAQASDNTGPCTHYDMYGNTEANYPYAGDPQMVFVNGQRMAEVDQLSLATGGKFYYDWTNKRMYISTNPSGNTIELAARPVAIVNGATGFNVKGIGFRRYATNEYSGGNTTAALYIGGSGSDTIENDVFTENAATGLMLTGNAGVTVNAIVTAFNGYDGMWSGGTNLTVENSVFNNNNLEQFGLNCTISCGDAGYKSGALNGALIKNNIFENNLGESSGFWCDTNCTGVDFINNLVKNNTKAGFFYEEDTDGIVAGNLFLNNATNNSGAGEIQLYSSDVEIYNNTIIDNSGLDFRFEDDNRPVALSGIQVGNNVVYSKSSSIFWLDDNQGQNTPQQFMSYLDYNSYYWSPGGKMYRFITNSTEADYTSPSQVTALNGAWEPHSTLSAYTTNPFVDVSGGNYTIASGTSAYKSGGVIPSDAAQAMGISAAAGQTRGAFTWPGQ